MSEGKKDALTYQAAGVDPDKAANLLGEFASYLKTRPRPKALLSGIGPFASCYALGDLLSEYPDPILVTCCDGVGTKALLALQWDKIEGLGQDLVAMNVNDLLCAGATPIQFLDYYACGKLEETQLITLLKSIQAACEESDCALVGGETAEMPGLYQAPEFDLAGFSVGICSRSQLLGPGRVKVGDKILALRSTGFHSNGYSLVRKVVEANRLDPNATPSFDNRTWREILLAPTQLYVQPLRPLLKNVHALAHLTGGGLYENLPRVLGTEHQAVIQAKAWAIPPLFRYFADAANLSTRQLLSTFNCGVGMLAILPEQFTNQWTEQLKTSGIACWEVGEIRRKGQQDEAVLWQEQ